MWRGNRAAAATTIFGVCLLLSAFLHFSLSPPHFLFPAELPSGLHCVCCLLPAACSAPLPHYVACDTVNDYMYMLHATPSAQMGTGGTGAEQSGKVCSPPFGSFGLLGQPAPTPPTMKSVTWKSRNKCFGSHLWKSPMRRRQRRQLATATVAVVAVVVVASWSFIKNT